MRIGTVCVALASLALLALVSCDTNIGKSTAGKCTGAIGTVAIDVSIDATSSSFVGDGLGDTSLWLRYGLEGDVDVSAGLDGPASQLGLQDYALPVAGAAGHAAIEYWSAYLTPATPTAESGVLTLETATDQVLEGKFVYSFPDGSALTCTFTLVQDSGDTSDSDWDWD